MSDQESYPLLVPSPSGMPPKVYHISKQDRDIVNAYIETGSIPSVMLTCKINKEYAYEVIERPEIASYIARRFEFAANKYEVTEDKVIAKINTILDSDGTEKYDPSFLKALDLAARILKLVQPATVNVGVSVNNPLSERSDEELDKMLLERMGHNKSPEIIISAEQAG